ncbi:aromatic acid exporter family protein [Allokutzneria multivorans]|uniref:Aromatic acid exporter family protein n=1 Tax=Allokutzneria multivorans TaxID=1142134 RepID=A0ABP7SFE0_9PSEU
MTPKAVRWLGRAWRTPDVERLAVVQALKAGFAAMLAWLIATTLLHLPQAFLAPYAALFAVEYTVVGTFRTSLHQIASTTSAVLLAALVELLLPWRTLGIGVAVVVGLLVGRWRVYGESGQWVALTALLILAWGTGSNHLLLADRLVETVLGLIVGTAVNALVFPPFYARPARHAVKEVTTRFLEFLDSMAQELRRQEPSGEAQDWPSRASEYEELARRAERAVRYSQKSGRFNTRHGSLARHGPSQREQELLTTLRSSWRHVHEICEVVCTATDSDSPFDYPDPCSRERLAGLLEGVADLVGLRAEPDGEQWERARERCEDQLAELTERLGDSAHALAGMVLPARRLLAEVTGHM